MDETPEQMREDASEKVEVKMADGGTEIVAESSNFKVESKTETLDYTLAQSLDFPLEVQLMEIEEVYIKQEPKCDGFEEVDFLMKNATRHPEDQDSEEQFRTYQQLIKDNKLETNKYKCKKCLRQFNWKTNLRRHTCLSKRRKNLYAELSETLFTCDICKKQFVQKKSLRNHIVSHADSEDARKPHKCALCERQFAQMFHLNDHMKMHTREKLHTCQFCSRQFIQLSNLKVHLRIHTGEKPYSCDCCGKTFTHKATLTSHMRIHLGIRPYKCELCDKNFTQKSHLNTHKNIIHRPDKGTYKCSQCKKVFFSKITFTEHLQAHRPKKPFACQVCPKQYSRKSCLVKHLQTHPDWEDSQRIVEAFSCNVVTDPLSDQNLLSNEK